MRIVLSTRGSRGDVYPFLALGAALEARGHQVRLCLPKTFVEEASRRGLRVRGHDEDSQAIMRGFGRGLPAIRTVLEWFARSIDEQFDYLLAESRDADVLVSATSEIAAASVAEFRRMPFVRVTFGPMMTGYRSNALLPWQGLPPLLNRAGWSAINAGVDLLAFSPMYRWRASLGLPRFIRVGDHLARHGLSLLACSRALCEPCPSWQGRYRYHYSGYCHDTTVAPLPERILGFLQAGPPPLYLGLGSVTAGDPERLSAMVRDAAMQTGCRVVLGAGWTGLGDERARGSMLVVGDVDHQALFPRTRGVVHHGGSGTTHTAARAGVPQLVLPQLADQFYWGHRVAELGLGPKPIAPGRLTVARLAGAMRVLLHESAFARQAATLGEIIRAEGGVEAAADAIEVAARQRSCVHAQAATPDWPSVTPLDVERSVATG